MHTECSLTKIQHHPATIYAYIQNAREITKKNVFVSIHSITIFANASITHYTKLHTAHALFPNGLKKI